jgi:hypothetical protein
VGKRVRCQDIWIRDYNLKFAIVKPSGETKQNSLKVQVEGDNL